MLPDKRKFEANFARRLVVSVSLVREAIQARPEWRETVTHRDHAEHIARALLDTQPQLVGNICAAVEAGQVNEAANVATDALTVLFETDPYLLASSICTRPLALAWMIAQWSHRDPTELRGIANRADGAQLWQYRYDAMHALAAEGKDVTAIEARIAETTTAGSNMF